jgi:quinol monooxygenase YgiN
MPEPMTMIAQFQAKPGQEQKLLDAVNAMIEPSLAEAGCLGYRPMVDPNKPGAMICVETWRDQAALDYHFDTPHFRHIADQLNDILVEPFAALKLRPWPEDDRAAA